MGAGRLREGPSGAGRGSGQLCPPWRGRSHSPQQAARKGVCGHSPQRHLQTRLCSPRVLLTLSSRPVASPSLQECPSTSWAPSRAASTTACRPCTATCAGECPPPRARPGPPCSGPWQKRTGRLWLGGWSLRSGRRTPLPARPPVSVGAGTAARCLTHSAGLLSWGRRASVSGGDSEDSGGTSSPELTLSS